jgi:hypothetical protein
MNDSRRALPQKFDLIHTGLQPGDHPPESTETVSTVFFFRRSPKRLNARELPLSRKGKTVETVTFGALRRNTGLKPGVNEKIHIQHF